MTKTIYCVTTKDLGMIEVMLLRRRAFADPIVPVLERKLSQSSIVPVDLVGPDLVTLASRVTFCIDGGPAETRTLVQSETFASIGAGLSVSTWRGLSLLGMRKGQSLLVERPDGRNEWIVVEDVPYQPEAARRAARNVGGRLSQGLTLVHSASATSRPLGETGKIRQTEEDDPGPSAA
ncbi:MULTISPECIES: nucleoside-diphosphate kinase [Mesorhizobium]|uniref:Nucleoside-diphosphate kinase n=1 Tax=Mesorhizobium abyssinicae TaxID=1209958 RepID=A0ABU5AK67_9HYPH|nr:MULTISPECIES: nucleoside-diphosphate kinase [Mesorhizobium]RVC63109.1 nucleoside-diphosphate kinase [Mesorhizobium sp. M4B.F.Ca.ET.088.02.2.1]MDX8537651.1 nucleoside-diphosphate kinase [Mesorhizobium abyssinicae]RUW72642.1 nucleoside-diphosphate kinase [Mesorhizobium sp. M4B.F.Ca.ET.049.02.1.2]RWF29949.1 MAG: nucleoside-diphosphate kinase [Mesorhizobium sp.]RWF37966.1 MAG: nucleoside-diphosphate kinase [Mesorhizobium sp.]